MCHAHLLFAISSPDLAPSVPARLNLGIGRTFPYTTFRSCPLAFGQKRTKSWRKEPIEVIPVCSCLPMGSRQDGRSIAPPSAFDSSLTTISIHRIARLEHPSRIKSSEAIDIRVRNIPYASVIPETATLRRNVTTTTTQLRLTRPILSLCQYKWRDTLYEY